MTGAACAALGRTSLVAGARRFTVRAACFVLIGASAGPATSGQMPVRPGQMPALPLTQLDDHALAADLDNHTFTLTFAQPLPIRELLLLLVRDTNLSIAPDPSISGSFIGDLKNVTVRQALGLILPPLDLSYTVDGPFIRVLRREPETRLFDVNDLAAARTGMSRVGPEAAAAGSFVSVSTATTADVFAEIAKGVQTLVSERGAFNVDRKAGLLQVTDFPERLDRVATYLEAVQDRVHRQVQVDARVVEVALTDEKAGSLDWQALAQAMTARDAPLRAPASARRAPTALRITSLNGFLTALAAQGTVTTLASPRLVAMNNEPAIVRALSPDPGGKDDGGDSSAVEGISLSVTPQIAPGGVVMLSVSPILTLRSPSTTGHTTASATRESDTLARVADGETIVMSGFGRVRQIREKKSGGLKGGWLGRTTVVTRTHVELLVLLTPTILTTVIAQ
jgi:MSHA biogenesis protein MshL